MSNPLSTIFHGDVTLEQGSDVTQFGFGDLNVNRKVIILGTEDSTGSISVGSLLLDGGARINKSLHVHKDTYVLYGTTFLTETHIDTTNQLNGNGFSVTGGNAITMSVGEASTFRSTSGNITVKSDTQKLILEGGLNSCSAIDIKATHINGGINMTSGEQGCVDIAAGQGGFITKTSNGNVSITANNGSGTFAVNSLSNNQNLSISLNGLTDSQVKIESSGINTTIPALEIKTTNTAGSIKISNAEGLGSGSLDMRVGAGGYNLITNTGGAILMVAQGATADFKVYTSSQNQNLTLGITGNTDSQVKIESSGTNATVAAIEIKTTNTAGNIELNQPALSQGYIKLNSGNGGIIGTTQTGGSINFIATGATSLYTNATTLDNQDLTVSVTGDTLSKVNITSTGRGSDAIRIETTNNTGGVFINSVGGVQLQSSNINAGVQIATANPGVPIRIGTNSSVTTILGDLYVRGNTSQVDQQVVTIDDNIIQVNSAPYGTSDGGLAIKRYQSANNSGLGEVVQDTPEENGIAQGSDNDTTHIKLESTANNTNDYYNGWWIKITNGTGTNQVRRIKAYDGMTKIATIYDTSDQTNALDNPQPVEGLNFITIPDNTSEYSLYPCHYVMTIWDESANEFAFVCSSSSPLEQVNISHYTNLRVNGLYSNSIITNNINNSVADLTFTITLTDNSTLPVAFPSSSGLPYTHFPSTYGIYMIYVKPTSNTTRAHAIFLIGRVNGVGIPGTVTRLMSVKGVNNEHLDMQWRADAYPEIYYRPYPGGGTTTSYKIKVVSL